MRAVIVMGVILAIGLMGMAINQMGTLSVNIAAVSGPVIARFSNFFPLLMIAGAAFAGAMLILAVWRR